MKKVFAGSWHTGGMNAIRSVFERLIAEGKVRVVVLGHGVSLQVLEKAGLDFKTIKDFGLTDVSVQSMEKLLVAVHPDLVLTGTSFQDPGNMEVLEQNLVQAGKKTGIKTLAVLDFWACYVQRFSDQRTSNSLDRLPDHIAIMDEVAKSEMMALGFPQEKLVVTGNPHFDNLSEIARKFSQENRRQIREKIGLQERTLFFFAGNTFEVEKAQFGYWDLDVIELIIQAIPMMPSVSFAVRLHPRMSAEDKQKIQQAIQVFPGRIKLVEDVNSQTLALVADLTIVESSTMGIEAVYMGRPCISLQPNLIGDDSLIVSRKGIIPAAYNPQACFTLLRSAASVRYRAEMLKEASGFTTDGKATERVVELVYKMLSE